MKRLLVPAMLICALTAACGSAASGQPTSASPAELPNPASVNCEEYGGKLEIRTAADGSQSGACVFADGSECDEWAFFRGECQPGQSKAATAAITLEALRNAQYRSPDWGEFQLTDGIYHRPPLAPGESADIYVTQLRDPLAYGDLDGDAVEDAAVILTTQNGGTGHFMELAVMLNKNGAAENIATVSLGDRVGVEAMRIEAGVIVLDMRVHGPNDPMCCASQFETWRFRLEGGALVRVE